MCLGIPGRIVAITQPERMMALAEVSGVRREVSLACVLTGAPEDLLGAWVLIHVGFAMSVIDEAEAEKTLVALHELGEIDEAREQMAAADEALAR